MNKVDLLVLFIYAIVWIILIYEKKYEDKYQADNYYLLGTAIILSIVDVSIMWLLG